MFKNKKVGKRTAAQKVTAIGVHTGGAGYANAQPASPNRFSLGTNVYWA